MNKEIIFEIYKAIRAQSWLRIEYINKKDEKHSFWLAVQRIDFEKQTLYDALFNLFILKMKREEF